MSDAFVCDAIRTPVGRYGGALAAMRADDLAALPLRAVMARNADVKLAEVEDIIYGCSNQAGEDNRNVARMAGLLAGLPLEVRCFTVNRLYGSSLVARAPGYHRTVRTAPQAGPLCSVHHVCGRRPGHRPGV